MAPYTGIHRHGAGWRAVVSQGRGRPPLRRQFPLDTPLAEMQAWRLDESARHRLARKRRASAGTFEGDAKRYLAAVAALQTFAEREQHILEWVALFGTRDRHGIRADEIRAQRDLWLTTPSPTGHPYAASSINHRLSALSNLWRVLDGKNAYNPVRDVEPARERPPRPRAIDYPTIRRIFAEIPDTRGDSAVRTKIRLRILAFTGLPAKQLMRLQPADIDLEHRCLWLPARHKGAGTAATVLPLLPPAVDAFRDLLAVDGCGPFSTSAMYKTFRLAAKKARVPHVNPYTLRHSFATLAYDVTGDDALVMALLQHSSLAMSQRYRLGAASRVLARKLDALGQHFGTTEPGHSGTPSDTSGQSSDADLSETTEKQGEIH